MANGGAEEIKTYIFLDLETTSLFSRNGPPPRITEIAMAAVRWADFERHVEQCAGDRAALARLPRTVETVSLLVDPQCCVTAGAARASGLTNDMLSGRPTLHQALPIINDFVARQEGPAAAIAHNGHRFDFEVLRSEAQRLQLHSVLPANVCAFADTIHHFLNKRGRFASLPHLWKRFYGGAVPPEAEPQWHSARGDVEALVHVCAAMPHKLDKAMRRAHTYQ